jgi:hypothetical protein
MVLVFASFNSAFALEGIQKVEVKNPRLLNSFGESVSQNVNTSQQIQISADIMNKETSTQSFVYIVQIVDHNNVVYKLTWFSVDALNPQQSFSPAISWTPIWPGSYVAQIYVWDSIKDANAIAPQTQLKITVS